MNYFWSAKKVAKADSTEVAAFAEQAAELEGAVGRLATSGDRTDPLPARRVVGETFRTGDDLQEQALYGGPLDDTASATPDRLVASVDGLGWGRTGCGMNDRTIGMLTFG